MTHSYESNEAFSRAFQRFHGVLPSKARGEAVPLRSYPKLSFQISIKGAAHELPDRKLARRAASAAFGGHPVIECYFPDRQEIWIGIVRPEG